MEPTNNLVNCAKNGDLASQKTLLDKCQQITLPLTYKYLKKATSLGMNFDDLRELIVPTFVKALNNFDPNRIDFYDYFKYLYLMQIKSEFRSKVQKRSNQLIVESITDIDEDYPLQYRNQQGLYGEEKYSDIDKERIYDLIVNERQVQMTDKEYLLIQMFFEDIEIKEMARRLNKNYTETFRSLKKAISKIKKYFGCEI